MQDKNKVKLDCSVTQEDIDRAHELIKKYDWKDVKINEPFRQTKTK